MPLWHAYFAVDAEKPILYILGPIGEADKRDDDQGWEDAYLTQGPISQEALLLDFVTSFDHAPSKSESFNLIPENYREEMSEDEFFIVNGDTLQEESDDEDYEEDFSEEELTALALAISFRVPILQEMLDRFTATGTLMTSSDKALVKACDAQIEALLSVSDKLELQNLVWPIE